MERTRKVEKKILLPPLSLFLSKGVSVSLSSDQRVERNIEYIHHEYPLTALQGVPDCVGLLGEFAGSVRRRFHR